jgi:hypothetical protein
LASAFWLVSVAGFLGCVAVVKQRRRIRGSAVQHKAEHGTPERFHRASGAFGAPHLSKNA